MKIFFIFFLLLGNCVTAQNLNQLNFKYGREIHHDLDLKTSNNKSFEIEYVKQLNNRWLLDIAFGKTNYTIYYGQAFPTDQKENVEHISTSFGIGYKFINTKFFQSSIGFSQGAAKQIKIQYIPSLLGNNILSLDEAYPYFFGAELKLNASITQKISITADTDFFIYPLHQFYGAYKYKSQRCNCDGFLATARLGVGYNFNMK